MDEADGRALTYTQIRGARMARVISIVSIISILLLLAAPSPAEAQAPLTRYHISVEVDWAASSLEARESVTYVNQTGNALESIVFNVTPAHFGAFTLRQCRVGGVEVEAILKGVVLEVPLPAPLPPRRNATVELEFQVRVPARSGRFGVGAGVMTLGNWFPIVAVYRGPRLAIGGQPQGWDRHRYGYGDPFFTEVADYRVEVTTSVPLTIAASGRLISREENRWVFGAERVRDFALGLSPHYETSSRTVNGVEITAYYLRQHGAAGARYLDDAAEMLPWLNRYVGKYTLPYLYIVEMYSQNPVDVGQEYPGLVFLSSTVSAAGGGLGSYLSYLIRHEVAHQWFYSMVGNDQIYEPWLDEALVTWLSLHFIRENYPRFFSSLWERDIAGPLRPVVGNFGKVPVNGSIYDFASESQYFGIVYKRGATFIEELYQAMGDSAFSSFLKSYFATFRDRIATGTAFLDMAQSFTEVKLNTIFRAYLSYPRYHAEEPLRLKVGTPLGKGAWSKMVSLTIESSAPLDSVRVLADDALFWEGVGTRELALNSRTLANGDHLLTIVASDTSGRTAEAVQRITVHNAPEPTPVPTPRIVLVLPIPMPAASIEKEHEEILQAGTLRMSSLGYIILGGVGLALAYLAVFR